MFTWHSRRHWPGFLLAFSFVLAVAAQAQPIRSEPNTTTAASSVVTINEVMYHPQGDDPGLEWVELHNQMSVNLDISGWRLTGGIEFQFPADTAFPANTYIVVAADPDRLRASTGATNIHGPFGDRLSNSGETLRLRNQNGRLLDEMIYVDEDPWPVGADGSGASLSKRRRHDASSPAANWRASAQSGGTPGRANFELGGEAAPSSIPLIAAGSVTHWHLATSNLLAQPWTSIAFSDTQWSNGTPALGYDTTSPPPVQATNVALFKKVIDGSGAYSNHPFDVADAAGNFVAGNVTDGSDSDHFGQNYWLGRQGRVNEYFTLDLGKSYSIERLLLRNTHNAQHNDRGTARFEIWAGNTVDAGNQLLSPVRILTGTLRDVWGVDPIPPDIFTSSNGLIITNARYLKFIALTANNAGNNVGLNEIEVYTTTFLNADRAYSFDGNLNDSAGSGFNFENAAPQFSTNTPAAVGGGQSLLFNGTQLSARLPDPVNPAAYTIAAWVNVRTVQSSSLILRTDSSGPRSAWSHQLRINGAGRFEHYVFDGRGWPVIATNVIEPGVWYHLAITAASNGEMRIYVNGARAASPRTIGNLWPGGNQWLLGSDSGNTANLFDGLLDELVIWHSVLSEETISALARGASPARTGGYYRYFESNVQEAFLNQGSSLLVRLPFDNFSRIPYEELTLRARYADGFVAFLNGVEILRRNAPIAVAWNSTALTNRADSEVINLETFDLTPHIPKIVAGRNVLAIQALNSSAADPSFLFSAELSARLTQYTPITNVVFTEVGGAVNQSFYLEMRNLGSGSQSLNGCILLSSAGGSFTFRTNILASNSVLSLTSADLGFPVKDGDRLFLLGRAGELIDAVEVHNRVRGRAIASPEAPWYYSNMATPGQNNQFSFHRGVVINEIMYHHPPLYRTGTTPFIENDEQWIELYNTSNERVDLTGWSIDGEISYRFPIGTTLQPGSYLVIANDAALLRAKYPNLVILGNFDRGLSHHSAHLILRDASGNPADEVRYHNSHPWPSYSNGGGSTLELRDPRSDNAVPESWGHSIEGDKANWRRYTYRATAVRPTYTPTIYSFHEFRMGLLDEGEALIDNITVTELPAGSPARQLLQNTGFTNGTATWRLLGNHSHSHTLTDPASASNSVLHLIATGSTSYLDNRLETTLKVGGTLVPVVTGRDYEIAFDAKWIAGSPQLHTELYYNKVAATTILEMPSQIGTPGRQNSIYRPNGGPTYRELSHSPAVPRSSESIRVRIQADDPDGVSETRLLYRVNAGTWRAVSMNADPQDPSIYNALIPAQANGAIIQFYIQATDSLGAVSMYPARGPDSRALIRVDSPRFVSGKQTFRTIMTAADSTLLHSAINMMSDDLLGCTVVHQEEEVFYDAKIRLHGSMFSRNQPGSTGMTIKFPADHRFRGSRESVIVRRRGLVETFVKHILNSAGGLPGNYDDVVHLVSHRADNLGTARLNMANYDDTYVDSQFEGDNDGTVFKLEGIRQYEVTQNGNPEGLKLSQPIGWVLPFDIANFGNDPEQYRWGFMIQNERQRDDYSRIVAMGKAFSLTGAALKQAAHETIDVDEWARLFALQSLLGIGDVYGVDNPHNFAFYVRPSDGRVLGLQNDWEFAFARSATDSIYGNKNVYKMLRLPGIQRLYQGHLLDLIESVVNSSYLTPWARHYSALMGENYNGFPGFAATRGTSVRSQLAARIPFEITSNGGVQFSVETPVITLEGRGWINVHKIFRAGETTPLPIAWLDDQRWQTSIPLSAGTNELVLRAYNFRGVQVGQDSINIATSASELPQRDYLRISEVMYHPGPPNVAEAAAGFSDADDFEYVELLNRGPVNVSLSGVRFIEGIEFVFSTAAVTNLNASSRVVLVKNRAAFEFRYGTNLPVAGVYSGALANGGELLKLVDASGAVIHAFTYGDEGAWPLTADGGGRSLVPRSYSGDYNDPANWQESAVLGGSPGSDETTPTVLNATMENGILRLTFETLPRRQYELHGCNDLSSPAWQLLRQIPPKDQPGTEEFRDAATNSVRFYRIGIR